MLSKFVSFQSKYEIEIAAYRNSPEYKNYLKLAAKNGVREEIETRQEQMMTESMKMSTQDRGRQEGTEPTQSDLSIPKRGTEPRVSIEKPSKMDSADRKSESTARETCQGTNSKPLR